MRCVPGGIEDDLMNPEDPARRFAAMAKLRAEAPIHALGGAEGPWYLARRDAVTEALPQVLHFGGGVGAGVNGVHAWPPCGMLQRLRHNRDGFEHRVRGCSGAVVGCVN